MQFMQQISSNDLKIISQALETDSSVLKNKKILLTGATGFVGKWLLTVLIDLNYKLNLDLELYVVTRYPANFKEKYPHLNPDFVYLVQGDVRNFVSPHGDFYACIHGAADVIAINDDLTTFDVCVLGTRRVLDFSVESKCEKFLLVSSGSVYGKQPLDVERLSENQVCQPDQNAYSVGKYAAEWLVNAYHEKYELKTSIARCFAFVGPYMELDKQFAIGNFIKSVCDGQSIVIKGDGLPWRTYMYAGDLAIWLLKMLLRNESSTLLNVGGSEIYTIKDLAEKVVKTLNSQVDVIISKPVSSSGSRYVPDCSRAINQFGLAQQFSLEEAIISTANWYKGAI